MIEITGERVIDRRGAILHRGSKRNWPAVVIPGNFDESSWAE